MLAPGFLDDRAAGSRKVDGGRTQGGETHRRLAAKIRASRHACVAGDRFATPPPALGAVLPEPRRTRRSPTPQAAERR